MIIIRCKGGLGNQLFQYALYRRFEDLGLEVKMDEISGFVRDPKRHPELFRLGIRCRTASQEEITEITDSYMDFMSRVRRKLFGRRTYAVDERADGNFDPSVLELKHAYLEGFWQTDKYFGDEKAQEKLAKTILQNGITILQRAGAMKLYQEMLSYPSVSLHIRRGDYLDPGTCETYGGICSDEYYSNAAAHILEQARDAHFYVFTNDKAWAREHAASLIGVKRTDDVPVTIVELGQTEKAGTESGETSEASDLADIAELFLMAACRHHIMANSSYSWWGSWLSRGIRRDDRKKGITIAPKKWLNNKAMDDIYTEDMIRL